MNFRSAKGRQKSEILASEGRQNGKSRVLLGGFAGRAGSVRGFGVCRFLTQGLTRLGTPLRETGAADPNAPSGASTAAPYFGARRLLQLLAFCKLQNSDQMFVRCLRFLVAFVLCIFLEISECS